MQLHGSIAENLDNAALSAKRLRGHPVYRDTLAYWNELLHEARRVRHSGAGADPDRLDAAIAALEAEIAARSS